MTLRDLVIEGVETAGPSATAEALAMRLEEANIGSIIIEEEMEPVGVVTDRDLALRVVARDGDPATLTASDIMTETPVTIDVEAGLLDVTQLMRQHAVRRIPVVGEDGKLVGIITLDDVLRLLAWEIDNLGGVIEAESPPY